MGTIVKPHAASDGAPARPDHVNAMLDTLYNEFNGNIDWDNIKAALVNAANGLVKLDADGDVPLAQLSKGIPSGVIVMWAGLLANVPTGWSLCDGTGSTPDLRDKFIYGWTDAVDPGGTGGAATHTHTYSDLPQHNHTAIPSITQEMYQGLNMAGWATVWNANSVVGNSILTHTHQNAVSGTFSVTIANAGVASPETDAGSTLPPYFKLAFIMKD